MNSVQLIFRLVPDLAATRLGSALDDDDQTQETNSTGSGKLAGSGCARGTLTWLLGPHAWASRRSLCVSLEAP